MWDIVDLAHELKLSPKKKGSRWVCSIRDERTPSCYLNQTGPFAQKFMDFGGNGAHGDVFALYMEVTGKGFAETLDDMEGMKGGIPANWTPRPRPEPITERIVLHDRAEVARSTARRNESTFSRWFLSQFPGTGPDVLRLYAVGEGTPYRRPGDVVFWYVSPSGEVVYGKPSAYLPDGKRNRDKAPCNCRLGTSPRFMFGAHLLAKFPEKPVCIVESEKTALVMEARHPGWAIWLATGGAFGCKPTKPAMVQHLVDREVHFFPDEDATGQWQKMADDLSNITLNGVCVWAIPSEGSKRDLADIEPQPAGGESAASRINCTFPDPIPVELYPALQLLTGSGWRLESFGPLPESECRDRTTVNGWKDWQQVREWYRTATIPAGPNTAAGIAGTITDLQIMVDSHLAICNAHPGGKGYTPYFERLRLIRENLIWDENLDFALAD